MSHDSDHPTNEGPDISARTRSAHSQKPPPQWRLRLPREHGAWVMLATAQVAGLRANSPFGWRAPLCSLAVVLMFLAREPAAIAMGHRTRRLQQLEGRVATRQATVLALAALACGARAVWEAPVAIEPVLTVAVVLGALAAWSVLRGWDRTLPGELLAAVAVASTGSLTALCTADLPLQARQAGGPVTSIGFCWATAFCATTLAVHVVKRRLLGRLTTRQAVFLLMGISAVTAVGTVVAGGWLPREWTDRLLLRSSWAVGIVGGLGPALVGLARYPRHLSRVGLGLAALYVVALGLQN